MKQHTKKNLAKYRMARSRETLNEVPDLLKLDFLQTAVNRIYYACFYSVNALMIKNNIQTKTHHGVRQMFGQHFVKTEKNSSEMGKFYTDVFEHRQESDYADFIEFDKQTVEDMHQSAIKFVHTIEKLL